MENLDSDLLRTFVAVAQAGSVTEGAARIHRSQSATSIQVKRLEQILGHPVFERHGRGVVPTDVGKTLLPIAIDVAARLDATLQRIAKGPVEGKIRLGIPDDHGRERLARIIADFSRAQPGVELDVVCALSSAFPKALAKGALDLAVYEVEVQAAGEELLMEDPTCWVSSNTRDHATTDPLPVALFDNECWWRDAAIASLEAQGKPYRVVYSSQSVSGVLAAVEAGIAVGLLGRSSLCPGLVDISTAAAFGPTPVSKLVLARAVSPDNAALQAMCTAIRTAFSEQTS